MLIQQHGLDGQGGMSLADIGRARGLSRERVRQIAERATEQLRGHTILQALAAEDVRTPKSCTGGKDKHVAETRRPSAPGRAPLRSRVISGGVPFPLKWPKKREDDTV